MVRSVGNALLSVNKVLTVIFKDEPSIEGESCGAGAVFHVWDSGLQMTVLVTGTCECTNTSAII